MAMTNPFLATSNPFLTVEDLEKAADAAQVAMAKTSPCGDGSCRRKHRPSGEHYSLDNSIRMAQLQADGKVGPQFAHMGGAKAKHKRRATEIVAEAAAEHAEAIKQVFLDGIADNNPIGLRIHAAEKFLKVEGVQMEHDLKERQAEFDAMNKEQLVGNIQGMLEQLAKAGAIAAEVEAMLDDDGEVVDADVVD